MVVALGHSQDPSPALSDTATLRGTEGLPPFLKPSKTGGGKNMRRKISWRKPGEKQVQEAGAGVIFNLLAGCGVVDSVF